MKIKHPDLLFELLEQKHAQYEQIQFIEDDPIGIPHRFHKKEDIEIAGFLSAVIAWGQRKTIVRNAERMLEFMDQEPHDFIVNHRTSDRHRIQGFVHRTFNAIDLDYFFLALQKIYLQEGGLELAFFQQEGKSMADRIAEFKRIFFQWEHAKRTEKHLSDPSRKSSAKRLNMYLRWMVRNNKRGVDFGLWKSIQASELKMPLDVHTANVGRKLGLLKRKQNDWAAVEELTASLVSMDPDDPIKYDFALFGMGVMKDLED